MSLSLLLEKYDVSTEEGLQKALSEIEKEEGEVEHALAAAAARAPDLSARLSSGFAHSAALLSAQSEATAASEMLQKTAALAAHVSAKVRQLDLARSRVAECQRRVHDLIDLELCSAGVEAAIKAHDYETGAAHMSRFLSMEPASVRAARARGAPDPRQRMDAAANTLAAIITDKFKEAARKEDDVAVEKLFKLFPQLGRAEEGVDLFAKYLANQLEQKYRQQPSSAQYDAASLADCLTRALEAAGAALERLRAAATGHLARGVAVLQPTVSTCVRRILSLHVSRLSLPSPPLPPRRWAHPPSAPAADQLCAGLAIAHDRLQMYSAFVRRKVEADTSSLPEADRQMALESLDKLMMGSDLTRAAQDILDHYLALERYFLEESIAKALKMWTPQPGDTTSSLVDDVFFIARKVISRGLSCGSVEGACFAINEVCSALERSVVPALGKRLRVAPPPLPVPTPDNTAVDWASAMDTQTKLYLAMTREAECGWEWSLAVAGSAAGGGRAGWRARLALVAAGLSAAAEGFRASRDMALDLLHASTTPALHAWADLMARPGDIEDSEAEADALPHALECLSAMLQSELSPAAAEQLLVAAVTEIAQRAEHRILLHTYTRESGLCVERAARRLVSWCGAAAPGGRERAARLAAAAGLLALDSPAHAALVPHAPPPPTAHLILARRVDFKIEDIKRLKL